MNFIKRIHCNIGMAQYGKTERKNAVIWLAWISKRCIEP